MSRDPRDWRNQPAPLMAYVSAGVSFIMVAVGVGIVSAGTIMSLAGLRMALTTDALGWWLFCTPFVAIGLGFLSAYHAFQQARAARAGDLQHPSRRRLPWFQRATPLITLTSICGGIVGWWLAGLPNHGPIHRWEAALTGLLAGAILASLRLRYTYGLVPRAVTTVRLKMLCPHCHQSILSGFETCPLCGAPQSR